MYRGAMRPDVRFGALADICSAKGHVRFAPNSDRESEFPKTVMSALPADMCSAMAHVCFGPTADIEDDYGRSGSNAAMRGKITLISVNSPGWVSTSIEPPCCLTMIS